tara:strand:- start:455 stop:823 length:369 start_codon:yes stop_codon:yes gene_type:complete
VLAHNDKLLPKIDLNVNFANRSKLESHFIDHGAEFGAKSIDDYLSMARNVIQKGHKVQYKYDSKTTTGYVQYLGNNSKGASKFAFVGMNKQGQIATFHTKSGKKFWSMVNGHSQDKVIRPVD